MVANLLDTKYYAQKNPDLARGGITTDQQLRNHFLNLGINEGRPFSKFIDFNYYGNSYPDLKNAGLTTKSQLFSHAEFAGASEGRRLGVAFNPLYYKAANQDLAQAGFTNEQLTQHYQNFGIAEGRRGSEFFDPRFYLDTYSDLKQAFGNNYELATEHFINSGVREGRLGSGPVAPAFDPGSNPKNAYELGTLVTRPTLNEFVGTSDPEDYYRVILDKPSNLSLTLSGLSSNTTLKLFADINGNQAVEPGEELASTSGGVGSPATINKTLSQGNCFIDVVTGSPTSNTSYSLNFAGTGIATNTPSDPGDSSGNALNIGTLSGSRNYQDFVGVTDRDDWYKFALGNVSNFNLSLGGTSDLTVANLYADSNNNGAIDPGEFIGSASASSGGLGTIGRTLGSGNYFVDILAGTPTASTSYSLTMTA